MGHWNMPQYSASQFLALANEAPSRVYKRKVSRVAKPSSAGNSPHSLRQRNMTQPLDEPWTSNNEAYAAGNIPLMRTSVQRKSRPTSWHPSSRHAGYNLYTPNCHPSWLNNDQIAGLPQQDLVDTTSINTLSTPITCPVSGDLISNDSFTPLDNYYAQSMSQAYTPIEQPDMAFSDSFGWPNTNMDGMCFADPAWTQASIRYLAADQAADLCHESVSSSDTSSVPPTPEVKSSDYFVYENNATAHGDDLVAVGLYDEPEGLSLGSGLLGGGFDSIQAGKGLKLEETFSPAPEAEDDDDAEHEDDEEEEDNN
ncbi:hypothetical protein BGW36DRAFT_393029 [Talaromyces proteolyticus]|uniref:Uncharacterized protein n=1 Tax=Talaromyces proteolyticus TaxID=1131652 RepID=A0AAD4L1H1_9EURO|nr:uncharacterized protein BGW36DRAFT_393029 [Talaromyces proteolyticus]KAH8705404.1 hypothetical protein BGW36DRAFT_393029 [Talaromyces proteolyticus]